MATTTNYRPVGQPELDLIAVSQVDVQQVGDDECLEYWIPAEDLDSFNDHIDGEIAIVSEWRAEW